MVAKFNLTRLLSVEAIPGINDHQNITGLSRSMVSSVDPCFFSGLVHEELEANVFLYRQLYFVSLWNETAHARLHVDNAELQSIFNYLQRWYSVRIHGCLKLCDMDRSVLTHLHFTFAYRNDHSS